MIMEMNTLNSNHHCDALVIHCIDFRFHEAVRDFLRNELNIKSYDLLTIPGAAKHLTAAGSATRGEGLLEDIGISIRLHEPKEIILINHADCGAYGGRAAFADTAAEETAHRQALEEAATSLTKQLPNISIKTYFASVSDNHIVIK